MCISNNSEQYDFVLAAPEDAGLAGEARGLPVPRVAADHGAPQNNLSLSLSIYIYIHIHMYGSLKVI